MRVLLTYYTFPPVANGVARYLGEVTKALVKKGINVEIVAGSSKKKSIERKGKLRIHRLPYYGYMVSGTPEKTARKFLNYLISIHKKRPLDIVEAEGLIGNFATPYTFALNMFSLMYNVPLILRFHAFQMTEDQKPMAKDLFWKKIISVCNKGTEAMYAEKIPVKNLETQHNAIDVETFRPDLGKKWLTSRIEFSENDFIIGTASRIISPIPLGPDEVDPIIEDKGIADLIKAFGNSLGDKKESKLIIAAASPPEDLRERFEDAKKRISEIAGIAGVAERVIVKEFSLEEMPHFYNGLDLFVLASHAEAFPMVLLEAGACKIPIVATTVGGIPELITNQESGFLVEPKDYVQLGKTLRDLLKSPGKRKKNAEEIHRKIVEKYDMNKFVEKIIGCYTSIISKNQNQPTIKNQNSPPGILFK